MRRLLFITSLLLLFSCGKEEVDYDNAVFSTEQEQLEDWRTNSSFGYYKEKKVNGFRVGVTYLPELYPPKEVENQSVHFLLSIAADGEKHRGNFLYKNASGQQDFASNVNYFNFHIQDDVQVFVNGEPYAVVLSNMENIYTLGNGRKIHFVAVPQSSGTSISPDAFEKLTFIYDDSTLGIGYTKFTFETEKFKSISNKSAQ